MKAEASRDGEYDEGAIMFDLTTYSQMIDIALILRRPAEFLGEDLVDILFIEVAMVSIYKREGAVNFAHLNTTGTLYLAAPDWMSIEHLAYALFVKGEIVAIEELQDGTKDDSSWHVNNIILMDQNSSFDGKWVGEEQEWCID